MVALDLHEHVVPVGRAQYLFVFGRGPRDPLAAVAVQAGVVVVDGPIDLELQSLDDVGRARREFGVKVDAAVAVCFALET